jgi:uncharacterized protein
MIDKPYVDKWLTDFLGGLKKHFGGRLVFAANIGSWARGEARPDSDIDCTVVLDMVSEDDLTAFRNIMNSMPDANALGSGLFLSVEELKQTPRCNIIQFFYGRDVLYGSLDGIIEPPGKDDLLLDVSFKANENLHHARHYLLFPHDLPRVVHRLMYPFKNCFYALQSWFLLTTGNFILRKDDMLPLLDNEADKEAVRIARDWRKDVDDRTERPEHYILTLERWSRNMLRRLESL